MANPIGPGLASVNNGQPTLPLGSVVDSGQGPQVNTSMGLINQPGAVPKPPTPPPTQDQVYSRLATPNTTPANNLDPTAVANNSVMTDAADRTRSLQSSVDYINGLYDKKIQDYNSSTGNANEGASRAVSALSGLAGSTSAEGRQQQTGKVNQANQDIINQDREQKIGALYGQMNQVTTDLNTALKTNNDASIKTQTDAASKQGQDVLQGIAKTLGTVSFDEFKATDPQAFGNLKNLIAGNGIGGTNAANMDANSSQAVEDKMRLAYNAALVTPVKYDTKSVPGYAMYTDPKTGEIKSLKIDTQTDKGYEMQVASDGTPLLFNKDTGDVKIAPGFQKGQLSADKYQVVKGANTTDAFGNPIIGADKVFNSTTGQFVSGGTAGGTGSASAPAIPQAGGKGASASSGKSFDQYGLLANTDFSPSSQVDTLSQRYLDQYIKSGQIPTAYSLGRAMKPEGLAQVDARARDLYFKATGQPLPTPAIIKKYQDIIGKNAQMSNNLKIQEQTVSKNVDLSLANLKSNGLNATGFKPLDNLINTVSDAFNDPAVGQLIAQNATIQNELGSLLSIKNAGGTTMFDKLMSAGIITSADSEAQVKQKVNSLMQEAANFADSISSANADAYKITDPFLQDPQNPIRDIYSKAPSGTIPMVGPDGKQYYIPQNNKSQFITDGGKPL